MEYKKLPISAGDRKILLEAGDRIFNSAAYIFCDNKELSSSLKMLGMMAKAGTLNEDLVSLMSLKGIGIKYAEKLIKNGIKTAIELRYADNRRIGKIISKSDRVVQGIKNDNFSNEHE